MSIRKLRFYLVLHTLVVLFTASFSTSAVILELESASSAESVSIENLIRMTDLISTSNMEAIQIKTPRQAEKAIQFLEDNLRQNGDIGAISALSPRILEIIPDNSRTNYLYAIALAAQGAVARASVKASQKMPADQDTLYMALANSAISKAKGELAKATDAAEQAIRYDPEHPYAYNILGQIAVMHNHYDEAIGYFTKAIQKAPQFVAAHSNLGAVLLIQSETAKAWQAYTEALAIAPTFCPALMGRAAIASSLGNSSQAMDDLKTCIQNDPNQTSAIERLVTIYLQQGKLEKAQRLVESSKTLDPIFMRMTLGEIALRKNQPAVARQELTSIEKSTAQKHYLLAFCDAMEHKFDLAIQHIELAEKLAPDSPTLKLARHIFSFSDGKPVNSQSLLTLKSDPNIGALATFVLGSIAASNDNFKLAFENWSKDRDLLPGFIFSGLTPSDVRSASSSSEQRQISLGMLFYLKGYYQAALTEFEQALNVNKNSFLANFFYALTLNQSGKSAAATPYLLQSVKQVPYFFPANYMLAEHYVRTRQINPAILHYEKALKSESDQGVMIKLGLLYEGEGRNEDAAKIYQSFIQKHAGSFLGYNQLAWLYAKQGIKLDEALELANKADEIRPENASVNDTLGWIYLQRRDLNRAVKLLSKANEISKGRNPDILYHLAAVKVKLNDLRQAKNYLEEALAISENFESANQAKRLLKDITGSDS